MKSFIRTTIPALLVAIVALTGCEQPTASLVDAGESATFEFASEPTADLTTTLVQELDLSIAQQDSLTTDMQRHDRPEKNPGGLWYVSARLQDFLTERQKARLFRLAERLDDRQQHKLVGVYGPCLIDRPGDDSTRFRFRLIGDLLSDEQREEAEAIRARYRAEVEAIQEQVRIGDITREDAAEQIRGLHDARTDEIRALLSSDQVDALEDRIASRGDSAEAHVAAMREAMIDALNLSDDQIQVLDELHRTRCTTLEELVDQVHAGDITRQEFRASVERLVESKVSAYERILRVEQLESAMIHDALLVINARRFIHHVAHGPNRPSAHRPGNSGTTDG